MKCKKVEDEVNSELKAKEGIVLILVKMKMLQNEGLKGDTKECQTDHT